ncbi:MAG: 50S ribosomal protein L29 [Candidatus Cloacimonadota bacterium]|nr:MAG: 50S ribosomal protein L29 [Candidatus Cloacimonadota bacterium]
MKNYELREMDIAELKLQLQELNRTMFNLRYQKITNRLENNLRIRDVRREIARVNTIITEKTKSVERKA